MVGKIIYAVRQLEIIITFRDVDIANVLDYVQNPKVLYDTHQDLN